MKKIFTSALLVLAATAVIAAPQASFTTTTKPKKQTKAAAKKKPAPVLQKEEVRGVFPRAFAPGNNPIQMLNPKAPPERYGTSQEHVAYDPYTGRPMGIKLFEIVF